MTSNYKSGFVAIIGRPNVGKSTLMNRLIGEKISIISDKPQTTRNRIQCILTRPPYQMIFVDTPGVQKPRNKLGEYMAEATFNSLYDMDIILFVVDGAAGIGSGDKGILEQLKKVNVPIVLAINKMDSYKQEDIQEALDFMENQENISSIIQISSTEGTNLDVLENTLLSYLPDGPQYYPEDMITDQPERIIIAEIIREKALMLLQEEVPHGIAVEVESIKERPNKQLLDINASIICEKNSHKGIVIGKGGRMLKAIGTDARKDIERFMGIKVYLELWVKIKTDWRNDMLALKSMGYDPKKL